MRAYGHSRRDKLECQYGCCNGKSGKQKNCRAVVDRAKRKSARRFQCDAVSPLKTEEAFEDYDNEDMHRLA